MIGATARPAARRICRYLFILGVVTLQLALFAPVSRAQDVTVRGARSPVTAQTDATQTLSVQERAARGEAPLSRLHDFIRAETSVRHQLPALTVGELSAPWPDNLHRIGVARSLQKPLNALSDGTAYRVPEGQVYLMGVASEGAVSVRVRFENMSLPPGARLFVYSLSNPEEVYGPYEGRGPWKDGTLWTPPMAGDAVAVEYFSPATAEGVDVAPFEVTELNHIYEDPVGTNDPALSCHLELSASYANPARAVGAMQFVVPGGESACTGTLLNTRSGSLIPYFITANHCISTQSVAQTLRVHWNYNTGDFFPNIPSQRTDGSTILVTNPASDFTFLRLTGTVPGGLWYNGWTTAMPAAGTAVTGIHHPNRSRKRQSFGNISSTPVCPTDLPGACPNYMTVRQTGGVTEGGSSGSELLVGSASDPLFVGNLWGGTVDPCNSPSPVSIYGRFDVTFPFIRNFLEDGTPPPACTPTSIAVNQTLGGSLAATDCRSPLRGINHFADRHTFSGVAGQQISISLSSSTYDTYLYLLGPGGQLLTQDDDSGDGTDSRIVITLPSTGTYTVESTSFNENNTGGYTLGLSSSCTSGSLFVGETVGGSLAATDCRSPLRGASFFADRHTFNGAAGQQVSVSLSSAAFDTYLYLLGPAGQLLAQDDDGGGLRDSRIIITLPSTGTYTVESTSYGADATGGYTLGVRAVANVIRGFDNVGLFSPSSAFFFRNSNSAGAADAAFFYGPAGLGWMPIAGDWNGDGIDTAGLYNPSTGAFYLRNSHSGGAADVFFFYGPAGFGWKPVVGDWNGDGVDTVGLFDPFGSAFFLKNTHSGGQADLAFFYGPANAAWMPVVGDWNGDGVDTVGLYNPFASSFFLRNSNSTGNADLAFFYGPANAGWVPVAGDWNNDGVITVGLYSPGLGAFFLRNSNTGGNADAAFFYGPANAGWVPLAGDWNGL